MVVFGGYSHKHNQVETCQDSNLYFFHLGCQTWVRNFNFEFPSEHPQFSDVQLRSFGSLRFKTLPNYAPIFGSFLILL